MKEKEFVLEEYMDKIVEEVVFTTPSRFDLLLLFVDKLCRSKVGYLCSQSDVLKGKKYEDDIMQSIRMRVVKYSERTFFCREDREGINNSPVEFKKWLSTVTKNCVKDYAKKVRKRMFKEADEDEALLISTANDKDVSEYTTERIKKSFDIVVSASVSVYKILCWLAMAEFMVLLNTTKIKVTDFIIEKFSKMSLDSMYDCLKKVNSFISWMPISDEQDFYIREKLDDVGKNGMRLGSMPFESFYMEKGAKKSISDWLNRMNSLIKKKVI